MKGGVVTNALFENSTGSNLWWFIHSVVAGHCHISFINGFQA